MRSVLLVCVALAFACDGAKPASSPAPSPPPPPVESATTSAPTSSGCPAAPRPTTACSEGDGICTYGPKTTCACILGSCMTPAGRAPGCKETRRWVCRDDGCPITAGVACTNAGQRCHMDDGMCMSEVECREGKWMTVERSRICRP